MAGGVGAVAGDVGTGMGGGSTTLWWWWKTKDLPRRGVDRWRRGGYLGDASRESSFRSKCKASSSGLWFVRSGLQSGWRFAVISSSRQLRRPDFLASQHSMVPPLRLRTAGACWLVRCEAIVSNAVAISTTASTRIMANAGSSSEIEKSHARRFLAPEQWGFFVSSGSRLTQNT